VVVAVVGGFAAYHLLPVSWYGYFLLLTVASVGGSILFHRWPLSLLVVPVSVWLGMQAADVLYGVSHNLTGQATWWAGTFEVAGDMIVLAALPAMVGAGIGAVLDLAVAKSRLQRQA
jgi:hypothetical protein